MGVVYSIDKWFNVSVWHEPDPLLPSSQKLYRVGIENLFFWNFWLFFFFGYKCLDLELSKNKKCPFIYFCEDCMINAQNGTSSTLVKSPERASLGWIGPNWNIGQLLNVLLGICELFLMFVRSRSHRQEFIAEMWGCMHVSMDSMMKKCESVGSFHAHLLSLEFLSSYTVW